MHVSKQSLARSLKSLAVLTLCASLVSCEFEAKITPIDWATPGGSTIEETLEGPAAEPSPIPIPPTPQPAFDGVDSLDCAEPAAGDNHFGYCRIAGTQDFYVWGECVAECPGGEFEGIELLKIEGSDSALALFRDVIDERDKKLDDRTDGWWRGGILGGLGVAGGATGIGAACLVASSWTFGIGCGLVLLGVGGAGLLSYLGFKDAYDAHQDLNDPQGLNFSAQDLFTIISEEHSNND